MQGGLAPKAVAEQQRRLEQLTDSQENHQKAEKQRKYAVKYHKVNPCCRPQQDCSSTAQHQPRLQPQSPVRRFRCKVSKHDECVSCIMVGAIARVLQVRFFERVKIERRIAKLEREPAPEAADAAAARAAQLASLRDDLMVTNLCLRCGDQGLSRLLNTQPSKLHDAICQNTADTPALRWCGWFGVATAEISLVLPLCSM